MQTLKSKTLVAVTILLLFSCAVVAQEYNEIWNHINKNDRNKASGLIETKLKNKKASLDEFITYNFLKALDDKEDAIKDFASQVALSDNPDAYIYALWFSSPVVGDYGDKEPHQLAMLNHLIAAKPGNGTLRSASHYSLANYYLKAHQFAKVKKEYELVGALADWQFVGPFNNISGSGFNKNYGPVSDPSNSTTFSSTENAPIKWFTPVEKSTEAWVFASNFISESSGSITFAQTFVNSPSAQDVYLCSGFAGNIKIWVNDQLVICVPEEKVTELDVYNTKCHLNAGYNRILVQVGRDDKVPNFIVRITDLNYDPITNLTSTATPQDYKKVGGELLTNNIPLFAETYFIEKVKKEPDNILNYMLLNRVYLRNKKVFEARKTIEEALKKAPNNTLLKYELWLCYIKENNRTGISEIYEYFKENESKSLISYALRVNILKDQKKYQEALDTLETRIKIYGNDASTYEDKIQLYSDLNNMPKLLATINEASAKYPRSTKFINYVFNVEKEVNKDPKKAIKVLEKFLATNYDYDLEKLLMSEYFSQNNKTKPYQILQEQIETMPYDPQLRIDLFNEYLGQQRYSEAYEVCKFMLKMKPFSGYFYDDKAGVEESMNKTQDAIKSYQTALIYLPTLYESRNKMRKLQNKKNLFEVVPHEKVEDLISKTGKDIKSEDYDYYYLQDDKTVVLYNEGGREEEYTFAIKILNQRGIDRYKETSLSYNDNTESLVIEEAELIKDKGKKLKPETNQNHIVWTGLEVNDVIYIKYKIEVYHKGKLAREFYDKNIFNAFVPIELERYSLIIPADKKFTSKMENGDIQPKVTDFENYKVYTWQNSITNAIKDEPYMPASADFAATLHISTLNEWNDIAQYYSDVVYSKIASDNDYEVAEVYHKIFDGKPNLTADEKAHAIYDYIAKNISYSSVSFRQSGLIPQKASKTIITHLGDCKDISTLFVSLANLCKLKANLVLVCTRSNGTKDMLLPSFLFNHCIVKYFDDKNMEHYLELTDKNIPFRSLPSGLYNAISLTIPSKDEKDAKSNLAFINTSNKTTDRVFTKSKIDIMGNDMNIQYTNTKYGELSSGFRNTYRNLSEEKTKKKMMESMSKKFSNNLKVNAVSFTALDELKDSISVKIDMSVNNEVKKIGAQSAFAIPYTDVIFNSSPFNLEKRKYDFEYWNYENADEYETQIEINLPADKKFAEIPVSQTLTFKNITYSIKYTKTAPNKMLVVRKAKINRSNVKPEDYTKFKEFVSKIIETEGSYVTFQ